MKRKRSLLGLLGVLGVLALLTKINVFGVDQVIISGQGFGCTDEETIKKELNLIGKNILFLDEQNLNKKVIAKFSCVRNIHLNRQLPKIVKVDVNTRIPSIRVQSYKVPQLPLDDLEATPSSQAALLDWSFPRVSDDSIWIADETGKIFNRFGGNDLPLIFFPKEDLQIGVNLDSEILNAINAAISKFRQLNLPIYRGKILSDSLLIESQIKIVISLSKDTLKQLASLQLILQEAKIDKRMMETIDLRFDKPVIVYLPKK